MATIDTVDELTLNPHLWVRKFIDPSNYQFTEQQMNGFMELGKLIRAKSKLARGDKMTDEEKEYGCKIGLSIMSGHGTGKDCFASLVALYFLNNFAYSKVICTAPTQHQLQNILWAEIGKWMRNGVKDDTGVSVLKKMLEWQKERILHKEGENGEWYAVARTINTKASNEEQAETLAGFHEDFMLYIVDEASGVPDPVFKPIEGSLTGVLNIALLIFNPTRSKGFAINSQYTDSKRWVYLRWNSEDSEIVSKEHIRMMEEKYGRDSNTYRVRVLGLPPLSDSNTLINWDWINDAIDRDIVVDGYPVIMGIDVGAGGDKSSIVIRQGDKTVHIYRGITHDSGIIIDKALNLYNEFEVDEAYIDSIGVGWGVYCDLSAKGIRISPIAVSRSARDKERFHRLRDELWWTLRERFEKGLISIPNDRELVDQLGSIKYSTEGGLIKVEAKKNIRARDGSSPDEADALMLSYYSNSYIPVKQMIMDRYRQSFIKNKLNKEIEHTWMAA